MSLKVLDKLIESIVLEAATPQKGEVPFLLNVVKPTEMGLGEMEGKSFDFSFFQKMAPPAPEINDQTLNKIMDSLNITDVPPTGDVEKDLKPLFYATQLFNLFYSFCSVFKIFSTFD